ncbi:uroporphyrinogen-III synthase [Leucoagaricus gongylophorus]
MVDGLSTLEVDSMPNVILLHTPTESPSDPYETALHGASLNASSIPVLETSFVNLPHLRSLILDGPQYRAFAGVIITSKRSCEAWMTAVKNLFASLLPNDDVSHTKLKASLVAWKNVPFYVVGKGTAAALEEFRELCSDPGQNMILDIRGQETGSGEQLARLMLENIDRDITNKRLLYLTGDKNRDTIPKILSSNETFSSPILLHSLQVYETRGATDFERNIELLMAQEAQPHQDNIWWIVFFAPSSSQFAYPVLRKHFHFVHKDTLLDLDMKSPLLVARVATIGRTTSSYLEDELGIHVDATATKPSPEALSAAITSFMH